MAVLTFSNCQLPLFSYLLTCHIPLLVYCAAFPESINAWHALLPKRQIGALPAGDAGDAGSPNGGTTPTNGADASPQAGDSSSPGAVSASQVEPATQPTLTISVSSLAATSTSTIKPTVFTLDDFPSDGPLQDFTLTVNLLTLPGTNSSSGAAQGPLPIDSLRKRDFPTTITTVVLYNGSLSGAGGDKLFAIEADASERSDLVAFLNHAADYASHHGSDPGDDGGKFFNYTYNGYMLWARAYPPWSEGSHPWVWSDMQAITRCYLGALNSANTPTVYSAGVVKDPQSGTPYVDWAVGSAFAFVPEDTYGPGDDFNGLAGPSRALLEIVELGNTGLTTYISQGVLSSVGYLVLTCIRNAIRQFAACDSTLYTEGITLVPSHNLAVPFDFQPAHGSTFSHNEIKLLLGALLSKILAGEYMTSREQQILRGTLYRNGVVVAYYAVGALVQREFAQVLVENPQGFSMGQIGAGEFAHVGIGG